MKHWRTMLWLFHVGSVAAGRQLLAVIILTLIFALLNQRGLAGLLVINTSSSYIVASPVLLTSYLLAAVNSAMARKDAIDLSAARIRSASRRVSEMAPHQAIEKLSVYLWMAATSQAVLTLVPAPTFIMVATGYLGCSAAGVIGWPTLTSCGMAYFVAIALAARQAGCRR